MHRPVLVIGKTVLFEPMVLQKIGQHPPLLLRLATAVAMDIFNQRAVAPLVGRSVAVVVVPVRVSVEFTDTKKGAQNLESRVWVINGKMEQCLVPHEPPRVVQEPQLPDRGLDGALPPGTGPARTETQLGERQPSPEASDPAQACDAVSAGFENPNALEVDVTRRDVEATVVDPRSCVKEDTHSFHIA